MCATLRSRLTFCHITQNKKSTWLHKIRIDRRSNSSRYQNGEKNWGQASKRRHDQISEETNIVVDDTAFKSVEVKFGRESSKTGLRAFRVRNKLGKKNIIQKPNGHSEKKRDFRRSLIPNND